MPEETLHITKSSIPLENSGYFLGLVIFHPSETEYSVTVVRYADFGVFNHDSAGKLPALIRRAFGTLKRVSQSITGWHLRSCTFYSL